MRNRKNIATYVVAALSILVTASSSQAAPAQTYHGTLTGGTFFCDGTPAAGPIVTGNWNVNIDPKTPALVTLNVFYDGSHYTGVRVQRVDAGLVRRRRLCVLGVRRHRDGDARHEGGPGDVLLAASNSAAAARPSIPTTR